VRAFCSDGEGGWTELGDLDRAADACEQEQRFTWLEVDVRSGPDEALEVARRFGLDPLAVEDALSTRQRPKLETYERHRFLVVYQLDEVKDQLEARQIAVFAAERFVLLVHDGAERMVDEASVRLQKVEPGELDAERALHGLLDSVVDDYERISGGLDVDVEDLEAQALRASRRGARMPAKSAEDLPSQSMLYAIKQQVSMLRRYALPLSGVVETLQAEEEARRRRAGDDDDRTDLLFRDVHDHVIRLGAQVRNIDDLASAVIDLARGLQGDTLNEINKKLSAWAAIIAIPTLIASIYGTNYRLWPSPDASRSWGFAGVVLIMVGSGAALWFFFKRKRWI
jgi:magnesium transporter